jgi:hypothetical protein
MNFWMKYIKNKLWDLLEEFQGVFAWHNGELGWCSMGEHSKGLPPCQMTPQRLSCSEEAKVNKQIHALVDLGKCVKCI